jgi:hypothetical protein
MVIKYLNLEIWHDRSPVRLIGLLVICVGLSTFAAARQTVEVTTASSVSQHWRGAYDILIRPDSAITEIERKAGVVEGNYLGTPAGGITRAQYEIIKTLPDVEVAAPVATVGFLLNDTGSINVDLLDAEPGVVYKFQTNLLELGETPPELESNSGYFGFPPDVHQGEYSYFNLGISNGITSPPNQITAQIGNLPVLWTMIAGIDPLEESMLVGLESVVQGEYLPSDTALDETVDNRFGGRKAAEIPLIVSENAFIDLSLSMTLESFPLDDEEAWKQLSEYQSGPLASELMSLINQGFTSQYSRIEINQTDDLKGLIRPMAGHSITYRPGEEMEVSLYGFYSSAMTNLMLYPGPIQYQEILPPPGNDQLTLMPLNQGQWREDVAPMIQEFLPQHWVMPGVDVRGDSDLFRSLTAYEPDPYVFDVLGSYDMLHLVNLQDPLSYVPLGIYDSPLGTLRFDVDGKLVASRSVYPTLNPADFLPRPPLALTTLEGAAYLRGREDFIDAIRVRVGGIEEYSQQSITKIEQVASEITERTGLHVDIVAGSSPQRVLVYVPGIGYIEEGWTTLGATEQITGGINAANITLFACLLLASGVFVSNSAQLSVISRREDIGILKALGWRTRDAGWVLLSGQLRTGLLGAVLAGFSSLVLSKALGLKTDWLAIAVVSLAAPCLYLISSWVPMRIAVKKSPAALIRKGERADLHRGSMFVGKLSLIRLAYRQVSRMRTRALLVISVVAAGVSLSVVLANIILQLQGILRVTLLGEFVALSVRPFHTIMILTTLIMGVLTTLESLLVSVAERSREFAVLVAFGWQRRHILLAVVMEGVFLGALGGLVGAASGTILFWGLTGNIGTLAWMVIVLSPLVAAILGALGAVYPAWQAQRLQPARVLSGLGQECSVFKLKHPIGRWSSFALIVTAVMIVVALLGGRRDVLEQSFDFEFHDKISPHPVLGVDFGEKALSHATELASLGPRAIGNHAEEQALAYVSGVLMDYGWKVEIDPVPLTAVSLFDGNGNSLLNLPGNDGYPTGIAVHFSDLVVEEPISGPSILLLENDEWPEPEAVQGKIIILANDYSMENDDRLEHLVNHYDYPYPFKAAVRIVVRDQEILDSIFVTEAITAMIPVSGNLIAMLPGTVQNEKEIWLTAQYDSNMNSPGADSNASGVGVLMELARILGEVGSPVTHRILLTTGSETGLEGTFVYLQTHADEISEVGAVLELQQVGDWEKLMIGHDLDAVTVDGTPLDTATITELRQEGQSFLLPNWTQRIDLSRSDLDQWLVEQVSKDGGLSESPSSIIESAILLAKGLGIDARVLAYPCPGSYMAFLYGNVPTVVVCGEGNDLAGSAYDSATTLHAEKMAQAASLMYELIMTLASGQEDR